jgi:toxin FitB
VIVLDTKVLSEALEIAPSDAVVGWLGRQASSSLHTTTVTRAELLYGVEILPHGKRRAGLAEAIEHIIETNFRGRILDFDQAAAGVFAKIAATRRAAGRPISQFDAMIAAIGRVHGAALATRDTSNFEDCGIRVINPWLEAPG